MAGACVFVLAVITVEVFVAAAAVVAWKVFIDVASSVSVAGATVAVVPKRKRVYFIIHACNNKLLTEWIRKLYHGPM